MGNARGNKNSRHHLSLNPDNDKDKLEFFDFSWEEIAIHDLPAMIDYTLASTNKEKLHYIGHSQGGTVFLVLNSLKPEYNQKIQSAHLWAGVGYQNHFPNTDLSLAARLTDTIYVSIMTWTPVRPRDLTNIMHKNYFHIFRLLILQLQMLKLRMNYFW